MVQIVLIRPCSTSFDELGRIQGTLDIPLSDRGAIQARELVEELRSLNLSMLYASPCEAASQTAAVIGQALGVKIKQVDALQNVDHGLWQGMLVEEIRRKHPKVYRQWQEQPEAICPPEGEMLGDAQNRIQSTLEKLVRSRKPTTIGLVVPEPLASVVRGMLCNCEIGDSWKNGSCCGTWELLKLTESTLPSLAAEVKEEKSTGQGEALPIGLH